MYSFPNFDPVCCSMYSSNCCFLTCIQVSQKSGKVVWYSHLLKNFPQFVVIQTVIAFSVVNEAEVYGFLNFPCFFYDPTDVVNLLSSSSAFSKSILNIWKFSVHIQLKPGLENFEHFLIVCAMVQLCGSLNVFGIAFLRDWNEKLTFSSPTANLQFSKSAAILSAVLPNHHFF